MNFDVLGEKVKKFSKDTIVEVQKMNEVRQLNAKINDEKKFLNRLYLELGQKLYDMYKDAEQPLEGFAEDFRRIEERYSVMDLLQDQIRTVKGVVLCPCCNMEVSVTERYCSNCGNKMPEVVKIEEKEEEDDAIVVESEVVEPEPENTPEEEAAKTVEEADPEKGTVQSADAENPEVEQSVDVENSESEQPEKTVETVQEEAQTVKETDPEKNTAQSADAENSEVEQSVDVENPEPEQTVEEAEAAQPDERTPESDC